MNKIILLFVVTLIAQASSNKNEKFQECAAENRKLAECCKYPAVDGSNIAMSSECQELVNNAAKLENPKEKHEAMICFEECFFKSRGMVDESGNLVKDKLIEFQMEQSKDLPEYSAILKNSTEICFEKIKEKKSKEGKCNRMPHFINMCVITKIFENCPEANAVKTPECDTIKANHVSFEDCMKKQ